MYSILVEKKDGTREVKDFENREQADAYIENSDDQMLSRLQPEPDFDEVC